MKLHELASPAGATKKRKRIGRGRSSGHGKTSCRGHKGQKSRSGGSVRVGFEGGQMPLYRRLPKRGFTNIFKTVYSLLNVEDLNRFEDGVTVTPDLLLQQGLIKKIALPVKILGNGVLEKRLTVKVHKFSQSAMDKIKNAQGEVITL